LHGIDILLVFILFLVYLNSSLSISASFIGMPPSEIAYNNVARVINAFSGFFSRKISPFISVSS